MDKTEFGEWLAWYFRCFPDHGTWFTGIGHDARETLIEEWHAILRGYDRRDLTAACHAQLAGRAESAAAYHRSLIAARLKEAADEIIEVRSRKMRYQNPRPRFKRTVRAETIFDDTMKRAGLGDWYRLALRTIDRRCIESEIKSNDYTRRMEIATEVGKRLRRAVVGDEEFEHVETELKAK